MPHCLFWQADSLPLSHLGSLTGLVRGLCTFYFLTSLFLDFLSLGPPCPQFSGNVAPGISDFRTHSSPHTGRSDSSPVTSSASACASPHTYSPQTPAALTPISFFPSKAILGVFPPGSALKHLRMVPYYPARHRTWAFPSTIPPPPEVSRAILLLSVYTRPELSRGGYPQGKVMEGVDRVSGHRWLSSQGDSQGLPSKRGPLWSYDKIHLRIKEMICSGYCIKENIH